MRFVCRLEQCLKMDSSFSVVVEGGRPWGFSLQGGLEFRAPLRVGKVSGSRRRGRRGGERERGGGGGGGGGWEGLWEVGGKRQHSVGKEDQVCVTASTVAWAVCCHQYCTA